jgi:peptidoglycan/LPS O-acetylase OafA/YrhL
MHIEQYRGLCALLVFINHGTVHESMLVDHFKWPEYVHYLGAGYLSVYLFFCISGYVIGLSNDTLNLNVKTYLTKRALRLYPIYIISILLCILVVEKVPVFEVLGNLLFLQNDMPGNFKVQIFVNFPSWSLNYEVLYYLLFIGLFYWQPKLWKLLLGMFIITLLLIHCNSSFVPLANYVDGFYFWILGLIIGWNLVKSDDSKTRFVPLLSLLFLHLCQHYLGLGLIILNTLGIHSPTNLYWLFDIPFCLMVMCILTNRDNAFLRFNKILCYSLPACVFIFLILNHRIFEDMRWIMCLIYWLLSLLFYFEKRVSAFLLDKLTGIGKISYALYLLHVPVAELIKRTVFISDQKLEIVVKYSLWIVITFALSTLLERVFQPAIKKYLLAK